MTTKASYHFDAVFFDLDDTLYDQSEPIAYAVKHVLGDLKGISGAQLFETSRLHSQEVFAAFARGYRPTDTVYIHRMQDTFADYGIHLDDQTALKLQRVYAGNTADAMHLDPSIAQALDWCSHHTNRGLGIISNGKLRGQVAKVKALGVDRWISADRIFVSDAVGVAKPKPEIFSLACRQVQADPEKSIYVGDTFALDVIGATRARLKSLWYNHRLRHAPTSHPKATWEVHTAPELYATLKSNVI